MREIKFRAWVTYPCVHLINGWQPDTFMANVQSLNLSTGNVRCKKIGESFDMTNGGSCDVRGKQIHAIMQYTGLKDKNGKEIYEGDIIRAQFPETQTTTGEARMVVEDMCSTYASLRDAICDKREVEVIGNIYENPDLIPNTTTV